MDCLAAMDLWEQIARYFSDAGSTRRVVLLGSVLLGISSGVLGSFALLRRQGLLGDALAHAALPGVCIAFMITGTKNPLYLLIGALGTGVLGSWLVVLISRKSRIKEDAAIGLVLSVFFGIGIVLLTVIQHSGAGNQAGLDAFLFGQAASLMQDDVNMMAGMSVLLLVIVGLFYKEFKILSFDPAFGASIGFPMRIMDLFLTGLVAVSVMIGLEAVGVVLMAAMLIIPAAAARQWTDRLGMMILLSAGTGALSGAIGALISSIHGDWPTGPVMVIAASSILVVSLVAAPRRGLVPELLRRRRVRNRIQHENHLKALYKICEASGEESFSLADVSGAWGTTDDRTRRMLSHFVRRGLIAPSASDWRLSEQGRDQAAHIVRSHRLWELYLSQKADIAADHVHRDAEDMEHFLSPELIEKLEALFGDSMTDPHGKPIPGGQA
jgi:manganese/zinc/iron transport system permease protein